jgi:hypothetical protein
MHAQVSRNIGGFALVQRQTGEKENDYSSSQFCPFTADWRAAYSIRQQIANQTHYIHWERADIYFYKNDLTETRIIVII